MFGGFDAGRVFVELGGLFVRDEFDKWDRAVGDARTEAKTPIDQKFGADLGPFERGLAQARVERQKFVDEKAEAHITLDEPGFVAGLARMAFTLKAFITAANAQKITI